MSKLEKLVIEAYDNPEFNKRAVKTFSLQINPSDIDHNFKQVPFNSMVLANGKGITDGRPMEYTEQLSFEFYIDATGVVGGVTNVPKKVAELKTVCSKVVGTIHSPYYLKLKWGKALTFNATLNSMDMKYLTFAPDGTPVRVKIYMAFNQFIDPKTKAKHENTSSPDLTHTKMVKEGDTLPLMCKEVYGDIKYYLQVAAVNNLVNIREIKPGTVLTFPPLN